MSGKPQMLLSPETRSVKRPAALRSNWQGKCLCTPRPNPDWSFASIGQGLNRVYSDRDGQDSSGLSLQQLRVQGDTLSQQDAAQRKLSDQTSRPAAEARGRSNQTCSSTVLKRQCSGVKPTLGRLQIESAVCMVAWRPQILCSPSSSSGKTPTTANAAAPTSCMLFAVCHHPCCYERKHIFCSVHTNMSTRHMFRRAM